MNQLIETQYKLLHTLYPILSAAAKTRLNLFRACSFNI